MSDIEGRPLRLLFLSHSRNDPNAGASRLYHLLSRELRARGHGVDLFHQDDFGMPAGKAMRLLTERLLMPSKVSRFGLKRDLSGYDAVMSSSGMAAPLFRRLRGRPVRPALIGHLHGLAVYDHLAAIHERELGHYRNSWANRLISGPIQVRWDENGVEYADMTITQNARDRDHVASIMSAGRAVHLIPAAVHADLLSSSQTIAPILERSPELVWFATWEARKGAHYVPGAFRQIRQRRPDARLTIGGTGRPAGELLSPFAPEDRDAVTVLPFISVAEQEALFNRASIFLFPSMSEGFGLALVEAMCFGVAAVSGATGFAADFIADGRHGRIVQPFESSIAKVVLDLLDDPARRAAIAGEGRKLAQGFTQQRMAIGYEQAIRAACSAVNVR